MKSWRVQFFMRHFAIIFSAIIMSFALVACGGGGGGSSTTPTSSNTTPAPVAPFTTGELAGKTIYSTTPSNAFGYYDAITFNSDGTMTEYINISTANLNSATATLGGTYSIDSSGVLTVNAQGKTPMLEWKLSTTPDSYDSFTVGSSYGSQNERWFFDQTIGAEQALACAKGTTIPSIAAGSYTVTYNGNGNTGGSVPIDSTKYQAGQSVTVLGNTGSLVETGYSFAGWNTQANGSGTTYTQAQTFTMGSANVSLYARWTANPTYTVTYNGNGNTSGSIPVDSTNYLQGQAITVLGNTGNLVKTGYSFAGWSMQANGSGTTYTQTQTFAMGTANVTLYAKWTANPTYTVTYNGNGNTGGSVPVDSTNYVQGQTVTVLGNTGNIVKTGYTFTGWNTQADGSGTTYTQAQTFAMGTANVALYAKWTANPTYTVTYNGNSNTGGSVPVDSANYVQGQTVTVLGNTGNLVNTGYSFSGWNTQSNGSGTTYTSTFTMGTANVTLYAMWTANPTYTITYNGNGNTGGTVPVDSTNYQQGQTVTVLNNTGSLVETGYSFAGWNTQANGSGTTYTQAQTFAMGTANVTLYAKWTANPLGYAYVANYGNNDSTVSQYVIGADGSLTPMTTATVAAGYDPTAVAVDPSGKYVYVSNCISNNISQYTIGVNGALIPMTTTAVVAGTCPNSVTVDPSDKYVYVANFNSSNVSQYTIGADGSLTPMTVATVATGSQAQSVTVDPSGNYAYVANYYSNYVSQYTIGANGALTAMTPATVAAGTYPTALAIDPSGKYAYVSNGGGNNVSQYTIGPNGALTAMTSSIVSAGNRPNSVTVDPSGKYAYVANYGDSTVSQYTIGANGALTPMSTAAVPADNLGRPSAVTVDHSGKYAYVTNQSSNTVSQYTIGANGALTPMTTATVATGSLPISIVTVP